MAPREDAIVAKYPDFSPTLCTSASASPGPAEARGRGEPGGYSLETQPARPRAMKRLESGSGGANRTSHSCLPLFS